MPLKLIPLFLYLLSGSARDGNGTTLQYSCLENPMDRGAWSSAVHGIAESWTRLSDFTFTSHFHALEKEMATHSSVLAWRIPGKGEAGGLPSMGSHRVGHNWSDLAAAAMDQLLLHPQLSHKCFARCLWMLLHCLHSRVFYHSFYHSLPIGHPGLPTDSHGNLGIQRLLSWESLYN